MKNKLFFLVPTLLAMAFLSSCGEDKWTEAQKRQFLNDCIINAPVDTMEVVQTKMCNCMLEKIMEKYPSYSKAEENLSDEEVNSFSMDCAQKIVDEQNKKNN